MKLFAHLTIPEIELPIRYSEATPHLRRLAREQYVKNQEGLCHHCGEKLSGDPAGWVGRLPVNEDLFPMNFFEHPVHLHHDHNTGLTIGAVHAQCNAVLWQYDGE